MNKNEFKVFMIFSLYWRSFFPLRYMSATQCTTTGLYFPVTTSNIVSFTILLYIELITVVYFSTVYSCDVARHPVYNYRPIFPCHNIQHRLQWYRFQPGHSTGSWLASYFRASGIWHTDHNTDDSCAGKQSI